MKASSTYSKLRIYVYFQLRHKRRDEDTAESAVDEIRRIYESNNNNSTANNNSTNNNGQGASQMPATHRSPSGANNNNNNNSSSSSNNNNNNSNNNVTSSPFSAFSSSPHLTRDNLFQYSMNYLSSQQYSQVAAAAGLNSLAGLPASILPGTSFQQSLPPSRIPSPHTYQRQSPPQSYNRSPPNFQSPPPAHLKRSASVSSRQSREESTSPVHQNSWSFEEQFKQVSELQFFNSALRYGLIYTYI